MAGKELPQGWLNTKFDNAVLLIVGGGTPSKSNPDYYKGNIPWMSVKDMNKDILDKTEDCISQEAVKNSSTKIIPAGTPIIATRMSLGKIVTANFDSAINQDLKALFLSREINKKYLIIWYRSITQEIKNLGTGTTVKGIRLEALKSLSFPLIPFAEQKTIADRLDTLLAQVEATKTRLERILQILKQFRQSVLAAAVSGRLTKDWRKQNPNKAQEWKIAPLGDFVTIERGSSPRPISQYITESEFGVNWIKIGDAKEGCKYIAATKEKITADGAKKSRHVFPGDFILSNSMSLGRAYIMAIEGFIHDGWFVLRLPSCIKSDFFYYLLSSSEVQNQFNNLAVGGVVKNIRSELVKQAIIKLPPSEEQTEIVHRVEQFFAFADKMEAQVKDAQEKVSQLTQSILAKAFRGELTAQWREEHPELISGENSAQALLERIAAERQALQSASRGTKEKRGTNEAGKIARHERAEGTTAD